MALAVSPVLTQQAPRGLLGVTAHQRPDPFGRRSGLLVLPHAYDAPVRVAEAKVGIGVTSDVAFDLGLLEFGVAPSDKDHSDLSILCA